MAAVVGNGIGNLGPLYVLSHSFYVLEQDSGNFTASNSYGTIILYGSGLTYGDNAQLTGGTITGLGWANGDSSQGWAGFNVSAVAFYNAMVAQDVSTIGNLFFGGGDTINFTNPSASAVNPGGDLLGFGGNDVFNITNTTGGAIGGIYGGDGTDTLNLSGTYNTELPYPYNQSPMPNFHVQDVETINLAAGADYILRPDTSLVTSGHSVTINASALGAANSLTFYTNSYTGLGNLIAAPSGDLVLLGGAGNDFFQGGFGSNSFNGGSGNDTVSFDSGNLYYVGNTGVTVDLTIAGAQSIGGPIPGSDTFISIENLVGTSRNDVLTGDANNNILNGGTGGNDVLNGGGGDDMLIAGGNSVLDGGSGYDTAIFNFSYPGPGGLNYSGRTVTINGITLTNVEAARFAGDQTYQIAGPQLTTTTQRIAANQPVALSNLFSVTDLTGDTVTQYQLMDGTADPQSGHFEVNGVSQTAGSVINITAAQLAQTTFVTGTINDDLQIRAFDGNSWSAADSAPWAPFTIGPTVNHLPVVTASNQFVSPQQSLSLSSLFSASDADSDTITKYQIQDITGAANSGYFLVNGQAQAANTPIDVSAAQVGQVSFVAGRFPAGTAVPADNLQIRAFDGIGWGNWTAFNVQVPANSPPVLFTAPIRASHYQTFALSSLFSIQDANSDAITRYELWDASTYPGSGHFVVNGAAQSAATVIDITAAQLSQTSFITGTSFDNLQIRAFDGLDWSAADNVQWSPFTISILPNVPPVLATTDITLLHGRSAALSSLFTVTDADNDPITRYQLWDSTNDPNSGHFVVDGVAQPSSTVIDITADQLAHTSFVAGTVSDGLQIRAFDGFDWSAAINVRWAPFTVTVPADNPPVLTTADKTLLHGRSIGLSSLFTVTDADNDTMTRYQLWDSTTDPNSGHFVINGVAQPAATVINISADQLSQTSFVAGTVSDGLQIRAYDGAAWSAADNVRWAPFTVAVPADNPPALTTADTTLLHGRSVALSSLFSVTDGDNDTMTRYQLWDSTTDPNSGHFVINGVAQPAATVIDITAGQLAQTSFVAGTVSDGIQIRAFDGAQWSAADNARWAPFVIMVPADNPPVLTTTNKTLLHGQSVSLSSLFSVTDADNDTMSRYQLWDSTTDPNSGHFMVNGVAQPAATVIDLTADQLAQTSFVAGTVGDGIQIRAFDGVAWSAADTVRWAPFTVTVPPNNPPVLTTADTSLLHGRSVALSSLFSVTDADNDTMTRYQLWDSTTDPNSGHFVVNGVAQPAATVIDIGADQLAQTSFVAGTVGDGLQIRAYDGYAWSAADNVRWAPFTVTVPPDNAPVLTTTDKTLSAGQSVSLSSLFTVTDADNDTMTRYQLWDSTTDPNSGHFVVNGTALPAATVIDITAAQLAQTSFVAGTIGDGLQIRAFDGAAWSAADNVRWAPFHVAIG